MVVFNETIMAHQMLMPSTTTPNCLSPNCCPRIAQGEHDVVAGNGYRDSNCGDAADGSVDDVFRATTMAHPTPMRSLSATSPRRVILH